MKFFSITIVILVAISIIFSSNAFASAPALPTSVQAAPFYWSEDGFGIDILRGFDLSIDPYLTPGVTEQSSNEEIIQAYLDANQDLTSKIIVAEDERAQIFVVRISGGLIKDEQVFNTFSYFAPLSEKSLTIPNYPFDSTFAHFALEGLPSKDKELFYQHVNNWLTETGFTNPFDVSIDVVSGDGTILQTWEYQTCDFVGYITTIEERLDKIKYHDKYQSEIIDRTTIRCSVLNINPGI